MNPVVLRAEYEMRRLKQLLPSAYITGSMESWSALYTQALMIKLMAMR